MIAGKSKANQMPRTNLGRLGGPRTRGAYAAEIPRNAVLASRVTTILILVITKEEAGRISRPFKVDAKEGPEPVVRFRR